MVDFRKLFEKEAEEDAALKNYIAQLPVYGVDPETGFTNYTNPVIPQLRLPVQGIHDQPYIPTQADLRGPIQFMPSVQQGIANVKDIYQHGFDTPENLSAKVFGPMEGGASDVPERTQAWPEKIVRSGTTLANDVMAGKVLSGPGLRAGDYSDIPGAPEPLANLIERTQDMAGLAAGGSVAATGLKAEKPGMLARGFKLLKDRLNEHLAEEVHNAPTDVLGGVAIVKPNGKGGYEIWNADKKQLWIKEEGKGMSKADAQLQADMINKDASNRAFRLNEDDIAGTGVSSLADRLHEHLNERPNVSNEYKGESMPEILARQRASEGYEAAIRDPETKKLYTGMWHEEVLDKIAKDRGVPKAYLPDNLIKGYINDRGRFLTEEAVEKLSQNKARSKTAMFRSDDEAGTAIAAAKQSGNYIRMVPKNYEPHATDWYHGSSSIDKVVKGIDPAKAESGPQIYFTDNPEIGSKYATDKKNLISRASDVLNKYELEAYKKWFSNHGQNKTDFERKEIAPILQKVKENHYNREGVLPAKLNIRNPLMADQKEIILNKIIPKLEKAFKNDKIGEEWTNKLKNDLNNNINSSAWTYIPKQVTEELKKFGFDGIIDKGGKTNYNEVPHNVAIPFYPQQVRSRFAKFDPVMQNKSGLLLSDDIVGTGLAAAAPRFYSHVENIAKNAPEKMTANEWKAYLKNKGATKEELEALRVHDLLGEEVERSGSNAAQGTPAQDALNKWRKTNKGKPPDDLLKASRAEVEARVKAGTVKDESPVINREDLINHLNENKVELKETILAKENWDKFNIDRDRLSQEKHGQPYDYLSQSEQSAIRKQAFENQGISGPPRFAQYQLAGGSNYRELLLSIKDNPKNLKRVEEINDEIAKIDRQTDQQAFKNWVFKNYPSNDLNTIKRMWNDKTTEFKEFMNDDKKALQKRKYDLAAERLDLEQAFVHDHWPGQKDIVVHSRMNDRFIPDENGPSLTNINNSTYKGYSTYELGEGPLGGIALFGVKPNGEKVIVRQNFKNEMEAKAETEKLNKEVAVNTKGYNTLHAEEVQSDWLQQGNSEGFKLSAKDKAKLEPEFNRINDKILASEDESILATPEIKEAIKRAIDKKIITEAEAKTYLRYSDSERYGAVKDAPFKSTWSDLMIKRLIRQANEEGKDAISWTPGKAQADRYNLRKQVDKIEYMKNDDGTFELEIKGKNGENIPTGERYYTKETLKSLVGKEMADKIIKDEGKKSGNKSVLEGDDLEIGGEFHKKFYDEIMVNKVNAIAKKYGARVEEKEIPIPHNDPNMRKIQEAMGNSTKQKIWFLKLTPELKKAALDKGFSMFETGLPLTPVDHDPFEKKKHRLVPVSHNPFQ